MIFYGDLWNGTRFGLKWKEKRMTLLIAYDCGMGKKRKKNWTPDTLDFWTH